MSGREREHPVECPTCVLEGDHHEDCPDKDDTPIAVFIRDDDGAIIKAALYDNSVMPNTVSTSKYTTRFQNPRLKNFDKRSGHKLIQSRKGKMRWKSFYKSRHSTLDSDHTGSSRNEETSMETDSGFRSRDDSQHDSTAEAKRRRQDASSTPRTRLAMDTSPSQQTHVSQTRNQGPSANSTRLQFDLTGTPRRDHNNLDLGDMSSIHHPPPNRDRDVSAFHLTRAKAHAELLKGIPSYNGKGDEFSGWRDKIEHLQHLLNAPDDYFQQVIISKLGPRTYTAVHDLRECTSVKSLLDKLASKFDPYATTGFASLRLSQMKQGTKTLIDHHMEIYKTLRGINEPVHTRNEMVISSYINSLTSLKMQATLRNKLISGKISNLEQVMDRADRLSKMEELNCQATAAVAQVECECNAGAYQKSKFQPNNVAGGFCPIHGSTKHDLSQCHCKDFEKCRHCDEHVGKGNLGNHYLQGKCKGTRCYGCGAFGHQKTACRVPPHIRAEMCKRFGFTPRPAPNRAAPSRPQGNAQARATTTTSDSQTEQPAESEPGNTGNETTDSTENNE